MKIFASDYDGTFFKHRNRLPKELGRNIAWVKKWQAAGNLFVFATGRSIVAMGKEGNHVLPCDYIVGLNGSTIALPTGEIVESKFMYKEVALQLLDILNSKKIVGYSINSQKKFYLKTRMLQANWRLSLMGLMHFFSEHRAGYNEIINGSIAQIAIFTINGQVAQNLSERIVEKFGDFVSSYPNISSVDICPVGVSKTTGIEYIAKLHNISKENIYAMGDSYNDIPMLKAYNGITVPEAVDEVKIHANGEYATVADAIKNLI
ncbi:MAG: Cof-type HAD-IIB family hydrolase [Defluviitaleaceae bacterium]|nr:Cof-type HAD-IIB family hydrolase [Defluviitaleaceae bacterium]